jgi:hypothetical protein
MITSDPTLVGQHPFFDRLRMCSGFGERDREDWEATLIAQDVRGAALMEAHA